MHPRGRLALESVSRPRADRHTTCPASRSPPRDAMPQPEKETCEQASSISSSTAGHEGGGMGPSKAVMNSRKGSLHAPHVVLSSSAYSEGKEEEPRGQATRRLRGSSDTRDGTAHVEHPELVVPLPVGGAEDEEEYVEEDVGNGSSSNAPHTIGSGAVPQLQQPHHSLPLPPPPPPMPRYASDYAGRTSGTPLTSSRRRGGANMNGSTSTVSNGPPYGYAPFATPPSSLSAQSYGMGMQRPPPQMHGRRPSWSNGGYGAGQDLRASASRTSSTLTEMTTATTTTAGAMGSSVPRPASGPYYYNNNNMNSTNSMSMGYASPASLASTSAGYGYSGGGGPYAMSGPSLPSQAASSSMMMSMPPPPQPQPTAMMPPYAHGGHYSMAMGTAGMPMYGPAAYPPPPPPPMMQQAYPPSLGHSPMMPMPMNAEPMSMAEHGTRYYGPAYYEPGQLVAGPDGPPMHSPPMMASPMYYAPPPPPLMPFAPQPMIQQQPPQPSYYHMSSAPPPPQGRTTAPPPSQQHMTSMMINQAGPAMMGGEYAHSNYYHNVPPSGGNSNNAHGGVVQEGYYGPGMSPPLLPPSQGAMTTSNTAEMGGAGRRYGQPVLVQQQPSSQSMQPQRMPLVQPSYVSSSRLYPPRMYESRDAYSPVHEAASSSNTSAIVADAHNNNNGEEDENDAEVAAYASNTSPVIGQSISSTPLEPQSVPTYYLQAQPNSAYTNFSGPQSSSSIQSERYQQTSPGNMNNTMTTTNTTNNNNMRSSFYNTPASHAYPYGNSSHGSGLSSATLFAPPPASSAATTSVAPAGTQPEEYNNNDDSKADAAHNESSGMRRESSFYATAPVQHSSTMQRDKSHDDDEEGKDEKDLHSPEQSALIPEGHADKATTTSHGSVSRHYSLFSEPPQHTPTEAALPQAMKHHEDERGEEPAHCPSASHQEDESRSTLDTAQTISGQDSVQHSSPSTTQAHTSTAPAPLLPPQQPSLHKPPAPLLLIATSHNQEEQQPVQQQETGAADTRPTPLHADTTQVTIDDEGAVREVTSSKGPSQTEPSDASRHSSSCATSTMSKSKKARLTRKARKNAAAAAAAAAANATTMKTMTDKAAVTPVAQLRQQHSVDSKVVEHEVSVTESARISTDDAVHIKDIPVDLAKTTQDKPVTADASHTHVTRKAHDDDATGSSKSDAEVTRRASHAAVPSLRAADLVATDETSPHHNTNSSSSVSGKGQDRATHIDPHTPPTITPSSHTPTGPDAELSIVEKKSEHTEKDQVAPSAEAAETPMHVAAAPNTTATPVAQQRRGAAATMSPAASLSHNSSPGGGATMLLRRGRAALVQANSRARHATMTPSEAVTATPKAQREEKSHTAISNNNSNSSREASTSGPARDASPVTSHTSATHTEQAPSSPTVAPPPISATTTERAAQTSVLNSPSATVTAAHDGKPVELQRPSIALTSLERASTPRLQAVATSSAERSSVSPNATHPAAPSHTNTPGQPTRSSQQQQQQPQVSETAATPVSNANAAVSEYKTPTPSATRLPAPAFHTHTATNNITTTTTPRFPDLSAPSYLYEPHGSQECWMEEGSCAQMAFQPGTFGNVVSLADGFAPRVAVAYSLEIPTIPEPLQDQSRPSHSDEHTTTNTTISPARHSDDAAAISTTTPPPVCGSSDMTAMMSQAGMTSYIDFDGPAVTEPVVRLESVWRGFDFPFGCVLRLAQPVFLSTMRPPEENVVYTPLLSGFRIRFHAGSAAYKKLRALRPSLSETQDATSDIGLLVWSASERPDNRNLVMEQIRELARCDATYRVLLKATTAEVDHQSWVAVLWQPVFCGNHAAKHSCGSFIAYYLLRPPRHLFHACASESASAAMNSCSDSPVFRADRKLLDFDLWTYERNYQVARGVALSPHDIAYDVPPLVPSLTEYVPLRTVGAPNISLTALMAPLEYNNIGADGTADVERVTNNHHNNSHAARRTTSLPTTTDETVGSGWPETSQASLSHVEPTLTHIRIPIVGLLHNRCRAEVWLLPLSATAAAMTMMRSGPGYYYGSAGGPQVSNRPYVYRAPLFLLASALQLMAWNAYEEKQRQHTQAAARTTNTTGEAKEDMTDKQAERTRAGKADTSATPPTVVASITNASNEWTGASSAPAYYSEGVALLVDAAQHYRQLREGAMLDMANGTEEPAMNTTTTTTPPSTIAKADESTQTNGSAGKSPQHKPTITTASTVVQEANTTSNTMTSGHNNTGNTGSVVVAGGTNAMLVGGGDAGVIAGLLDFYQWAQYDASLIEFAEMYCRT